MKTNQGTSVPSEPRADTSFVHWEFERYRTSKSCGAKKFFGTERAVGLLSWLEEMKYTRGRAVAIAQPWEDLKKLLMEEYCSGNTIKKLKEEFWNHVMIGADVDKYTT
ncbi:hypothetical protein Tco_0727323 [Tanacetum coccineum]|uniref:Retrotransposon gag domain-containing protein n=1 Tax=Tanacetum coccineum TaxID=301880 RepID=A0ABQ4YKK7_9ASTR